MSNKMKADIQKVVDEMMGRIMNRVLVEDPFLKEDHHAKKPLYAALVPDEIFKGSHFERRFVTPFGDVWEKLAMVAAESAGGIPEKGRSITGNINKERLRRIQEVLNNLEHSAKGRDKQKPDWDKELEFVLGGKDSKLIPSTVVSDVYIEYPRTGNKLAIELKAPLPNSDQTKVSKEKILKLYAMEPCLITEAYYALPYNPYGKDRIDYKWSFPGRWFDMQTDESVLIGIEFWEKIGGKGTYQAFIDAVNEIGGDYKKRIYEEYLEVEVPEEILKEGALK